MCGALVGVVFLLVGLGLWLVGLGRVVSAIRLVGFVIRDRWIRVRVILFGVRKVGVAMATIIGLCISTAVLVRFIVFLA